ncbi:MAG: formylglycine-generating enzyme family protein [Planctomycetes bacterium]|nr:formylglycine-generating enzyme family protein [Planctomycetota bacterium]
MNFKTSLSALLMACSVVVAAPSAPPATAPSKPGTNAAAPAKPETTPPAVPATAGAAGDLAWAEVLEAKPDPKVVTDADLLSRIAATGLPWRVKDKASGIEMLLVPPGKFMMGASPGDDESAEMEKFLAEKYPEYKYTEHPAHEVTITKPFYLGRTEVTQDQWRKVMLNNPSKFLISDKMKSDSASLKKKDQELVLPVEQVSWDDCQKFCEKTGLRLPTEAQWEYACRAGNPKSRYGEIESIAWSEENAADRTHPVGLKASNALGFQDMIGNVWEWCSDWYQGDYYSACASGVVDPAGPEKGEWNGHVLRGGSWDSRSVGCRASMRRYFAPTLTVNYLGFRAARTP